MHDHEENTERFEGQVAEIRSTLGHAGHVDDEEIDAELARQDAATTEVGARIVARAWTDPEFREALLADANAVVDEFGVTLTNSPRLEVVANSDDVHHMLVCTLCSCYPRAVLGLPPEWYKSFYYRSKAVRDPRGLLEEFGLEIPEDVRIEVHDSTADLRFLVLPQRPEGTDGWSEEQLAELVTRNSMIGTGQPRSPQAV